MAHVHRIDPRLVANARSLRVNATNAERLLWSLVRNRQLAGLKFRRQHPLGPYVLDFYCPDARVAIELDGGHHGRDEQRSYDLRRSELLRDRAVQEIRFRNQDVLLQTEAVLEAIWCAVVKDRSTSKP